MVSKIGNKYRLKGTETRSDIIDRIGGSGGGSRSKLKVKKKSKPDENVHPEDWENFFGGTDFKPTDSNLKYTKKLLEHHGITETEGSATSIRRASRPFADPSASELPQFQVLNDNPNSFKIRLFEDYIQNGLKKTQQTTLTNPNLGKILNLLGY